jgi:hypothetical protein
MPGLAGLDDWSEVYAVPPSAATRIRSDEESELYSTVLLRRGFISADFPWITTWHPKPPDDAGISDDRY